MTRPKGHLSIQTSSLFSSPYRPSQPSPSSASAYPNPDMPQDRSLASSSTQNDGPETPLLLNDPNMVEKGHESFPFPAHQNGRFARFRLALSRGMRGGAVRRLVWVILLAALLGIFWHSGSPHDGLRQLLPDSGRSMAQQSTPHGLDRPNEHTGTSGPPLVDSQTPDELQSGSGSAHGHASPGGGRPGSSSPLKPPTFNPGQNREIDRASDSLPVDATLRQRLDVWRNAPGGRGDIDGEIELGGFVQWNLEQCGDTIGEQLNTHMIQKGVNVWATMNRTTLHQNRMDLINHMEDVLEQGLINEYGEGRGIVMVAGNADTLTRVKWSLQMLRSYDSKLPVQIFHFPDEALPEDDPLRLELRELGAEMVEAKGQHKDAGKTKSYHLKAIAVVQCPWREVLYLDSDSIPARDPDYMFDAPNYKRLGLWATPDYWKTSANNPIWAIMGVKCRNEWEMETGQMFIDKKLHLDVFLLIKYMLENHEWWFYFSDGDKDIFRWAMLALRKRWGVPGRWVGAGALPSGTASGDFCAHTMLQHDSWGEPLFVHYNLLKQIPSGVGRGYSWGKTKQLPLFNTWPATPSTARLGEPKEKPVDDDLPGLGDVDCDMLADADEYGVGRAQAKEMIMRRAVRERGVKTKYHGGWISALCIDLEYIDPRPEDRKEADKKWKEAKDKVKKQREEEWQASVEEAKAAGLPEPEMPEEEPESPVRPDWEESPLEVVMWAGDPFLQTFENTIYDFGFQPSGPGF